MAFVQVEDVGRDSHGSQRSNTADAQDNLLPQPLVGLGHVQAIGDRARLGRIAWEVGVEQEQRHAPDLGLPHRDFHVGAADGGLDLDAFHLLHRQVGALVLRIDLDLPGLGVDVLASESLLVEKADGDERQADVARGLQVVAGEDAEAARVDGQAFGDAELEREVPDDHGRVRVEEWRVAVVVLAERGFRFVERFVDVVTLQRFLDAFIAQLAEQEHWILTRLLPSLGVDCAKEILDRRLPRPEKVVCEFVYIVRHGLTMVSEGKATT